MSFPHLLSPVRIGSMELRNRLVMSPMENCYATQEGLPSERTVAYFEARARGGVGLITLGACTIDAGHREVPNSIDFGRDEVIAAHRELTDRIHAHGARIQPQLVHPGPDGLAPYLSGQSNIGPSVIPSYLTGIACRELSAEELPAIVEQFAAAALRVREAGYDGLELHAAHGYMLLGSFLTPSRNRRTDEYAGDSPEGRTRLVVEVIRAIQAAAGADFPITLRVSGYEGVPGGRSLQDTQAIAPGLARAGVDAFHVSGGVIDPLTSRIVTGSHYGPAHNLAAASAVKQVVDVPVMTVGRIHDPELAERILAEGRADLVVMGRPFLADAELALKLASGRAGEIRPCISCQSCIDSMETGRMSCAVNPSTGRELELDLRRAAVAKQVLVVGGGPAGLEAARLAAQRGHRVALYEREDQLGGALILASIVHRENEPFLEFLRAEVDRSGVTVHLGRELDADAIAALSPDAVVVATGGRRLGPELPGRDRSQVTSMCRLLAGPLPSAGPLPLGERVAIVGGDLAAIELAEFLAERGHRVSVVEPGPEVAAEVGPKRRGEHMDRLDRLGVVLHTGMGVEGIEEDALRLAGGGRLAADSVVLAGEVVAETSLYDALEDRVPEVHAIGDCTGPGLIRKATEEGARVACAL